MNIRYIHRDWSIGDDVAWDDLNWDCYGVRRHGQITRVWKALGLAWVHEDNGYNYSIETFRLMEPCFP